MDEMSGNERGGVREAEMVRCGQRFLSIRPPSNNSPVTYFGNSAPETMIG